jgi:hypothetical protein
MNADHHSQQLLTHYVLYIRLTAAAGFHLLPYNGFCTPQCTGRVCRGCAVSVACGYGVAGECNEEIPCPLCFPYPYVAVWCAHRDDQKRLLELAQFIVSYGSIHDDDTPSEAGYDRARA